MKHHSRPSGRLSVLAAVVAAGLLAGASGASGGTLTQSVSASGWDRQDRRQAAIDAGNAVLARFNAYGDFTLNNDGDVGVVYGSGTPTADAGYNGQIRFGGTWPNERVYQHELNHWLGSGTYWNWANQFNGSGVWTGARLSQLIQQFDGQGTVLHESGPHFYGYGLNYDNEVINGSIFMRNVAIMYAMRQDMGNGVQANPWSAKTVALKASDAFGTSAFNWYGAWGDDYFAHAGTDYSTGNFLVRTPTDTYDAGAATPSFTFAGDSLTLNNRANPDGGLLFKGVGTSGVITINNLILDHGTIRHGNGAGDVMQLAGKVKVLASSYLMPTNGSLNINSVISGGATLTIGDGNGIVTFTNAANTFRGNLDVAGKFTLANASPLTFAIGQNGVNNTLSGTTADAVTLNGLFNFDLSAAGTVAGSQWAIVSAVNAAYGSTFAVNGFTESTAGLWTNGLGYTFSEATGKLTFGGVGLPIPEPASLAAFGMAGVLMGRRRR